MAETRLARGDGLDHLHIAAHADTDAKLMLAHRPHRAKINLRGGGPAFAAAVASVIGAEPPAPGSLAGSGQWTLAGLGPDEWLALGDDSARQDVMGALRSALDGQHAAVVDVSDNYTTIVVGGSAAAEALAGACPADLHPRAFAGSHQVVQTYFASVDVILYQTVAGKTGDADFAGSRSFQLILRRSFADHVWRWLVDAGRSCGVAILA
ncbi:MAG: sarcosine oxidase subunit gamma [Rhodospirillaceae bacterium]|nr:sarcosine oxidase subunit gamma [Rhodospirillaceae bacterium]